MISHKTISNKSKRRKEEHEKILKNGIQIKERQQIDKNINIGVGWKHIIIKKYNEDIWNYIQDNIKKYINYEYHSIKIAFKKSENGNMLFRMFFIKDKQIHRNNIFTYIKFKERLLVENITETYRLISTTTKNIEDHTEFIINLQKMLKIF